MAAAVRFEDSKQKPAADFSARAFDLCDDDVPMMRRSTVLKPSTNYEM
jgi:hypothetical protein